MENEGEQKTDQQKSPEEWLVRMKADFLAAHQENKLELTKAYWELALNKIFNETRLIADERMEERRRLSESDLEMFRSVISYGQATLKTILLINGGAAIAMLAFMGHLATNAIQKASVPLFALPMRYWCWGLFLCGLATGLTYLSQRLYSKKKQGWGHLISAITVILGFASLILFIVGCSVAETQFLKMTL